MSALALLAARLCLPLLLAVDPVKAGLPVPPAGEEFDGKLEESKQEAVRLYPASGDPNSILSRAIKEVESQRRRQSPDFFAWPEYPLELTKTTAASLRIHSPYDPVFTEVVPIFTTKKGTTYSRLTVKKIRRDGIDTAHAAGSTFIPISDLTDPQRDKYDTRWSTERIPPESIVRLVELAARTRDRDIQVFYTSQLDKHRKEIAAAKFDFDRQYFEWSRDSTLSSIILQHRDKYVSRLFELAVVAEEAGHKESLAKIDKELCEPLPEETKSIFTDLDVRLKAQSALYEPLRTHLRDKRCELLRDGQVLLSGIPKKGNFGHGRLELRSPDHIEIIHHGDNDFSRWIFKIDVVSGTATLVPEASKNEEGGVVTLRFPD
jgi:hypothetical protein